MPLSVVGQSQELIFHQLPEELSASQSTPYFLFQDSRSYLWVGTNDGLVRYDGAQITKYQYSSSNPNSIAENQVTSKCFEDRASNLWFSTYGALNCYRRASDDFVSFVYPGMLKDYHVFHIEENGHIWVRIGVGKAGSLWIFDPTNLTFTQSIPLAGQKCYVRTSKDGSLQIITSDLPDSPGISLSMLSSGENKVIDLTKNTLGTSRRRSGTSKGCYIDEEGTVWVSVYNGVGFLKKEEETGFLVTDRDPEVIQEFGEVWNISSFGAGYLLLATDKGLILFDKKRKVFTTKEQLFDGVPFNSLNNLLLDAAGTLWITSTKGELAYSSIAKSKFHYLPEMNNQVVSSVTQAKNGHIWVSTVNHGTTVFKSDGKRVNRVTTLKNIARNTSEFPLPEIVSFLLDDNNQWWGNMDNNFMLWDTTLQQFSFGEPYYLFFGADFSEIIDFPFTRQNGEQLVVKNKEVFRLHLSLEKVDTSAWYDLEYLQLSNIKHIFEDRNQRLFIADEAGRMCILKEEGNLLMKTGEIKDLGVVNDMQEDSVRNLIWIASSRGLWQFDPDNLEAKLLNKKKDNITSENYVNVLIDHQQNLWLPGSQGLIQYRPESKFYHRYTTSDGLLTNTYIHNASLVDPTTGQIWLGSKNGLNVFHPDSITLSSFQPDIHFSHFLLNDEPYDLRTSKRNNQDGIFNLNEKEGLRFNHAENTLSFEFVALDFSDPAANEYYYQLEGFDEERVYGGTQNFVRYANLPAGDYDFKVWATNSDKVINKTPKILAITVIPPFYQRWWFYLVCLLLVATIVYAIFNYRLEQALKVERLRVKISSDLHDDVGGMLSGLAMQTELLELTATEETKPKLARIAELSRTAMSRMRDTVWAIDARKDKLENLLDRMREHAVETLEPKGIQYAIDASNLDLKTDLTTDVRQSFYLIYKEAITNAAKHTNGDTVNIHLRENTTGFTLVIHDNGRVVEKKHATTGLGQSNMQMRAKGIDATLEIDTSEGYKLTLWRKSL